MSTAHQGIKVNASATKIGATLGLESTHHYECQLQSAGRRKGELVGLWAFRLSELHNHSLPAKDFYLFVHTDLYRQQLFNLFCRGINNKYLVSEMYKNEITEIFAGVAFCQNLIVSDQVSEAATNFGKTNSSHSFSMADEVKLLTRKHKDFSDDNALGYSDKGDYRRKKKNDNCLCNSDKHWAKDCALSLFRLNTNIKRTRSLLSK